MDEATLERHLHIYMQDYNKSSEFKKRNDLNG